MDSVTQQLADLQRLQTRALETAPEEVQPDKPIQPVRPIRPSQHTQVVAARSHKILITIAAVLFLCIVIVLLLSLF